MENKATTLENLFENVEQYSKTSFELYKHKAVYEIATLTSALAVRFILTIVVVLVSLFASIGLALWIGEICGKDYFGFLAVALLYGVVWLILSLFKISCIKKPITEMVIKSMLKTDPKQ